MDYNVVMTSETNYSRYLPGMLTPPPGEQAILDKGGVDYRKIMTPKEAAGRLALLGFSEKAQNDLFDDGFAGHHERTMSLIKIGGIPRVESVVSTNIRILDLLQRGPLDPMQLSMSELHVIAPVINDPDMQCEAVKDALAVSRQGAQLHA